MSDNLLVTDDKIDELFVQTLDVDKCPIEKITVYRSQAMITRLAQVTFSKTGQQQVVVDRLTSSTLPETVRVAGLGHCAILEVAYKQNIATEKLTQAELKPQIEALQAEIDAADVEIADLNEKELGLNRFVKKNIFICSALARVQKEKAFLEEYATAIVKVSRDDRHVPQLLGQTTLESITEFMKFKLLEDQRIQGVIDTIEKERKDINTKRNKIRENTNKTRTKLNALKNNTENRNRVVVTVDVSKADTEAQFSIQYMVQNASWKASYDARVITGESSTAFKLTYYGVITQNTSESWDDCNISLSTANTTAARSEPPALKSLYVNLQYTGSTSLFSKRRQHYGVRLQQNIGGDDDDDADNDANDSDEEDEQQQQPEMAAQQATAESSVTSSVFHIPRNATIPSDNQPHKVTVTTIDLPSVFSHYTVPKLDANSYIKVKTKNTSEFQLLSGPMNIFFDNNFVAKGKMKNTNVGEKFKTYLGLDASVKLDYKSPHRFKEVQGVISKVTKVTVTRKFTIKNTKTIPIDIVAVDAVPKTTDEKIKVLIHNPDIKVPAATEIEKNKLTKVIVENVAELAKQNVKHKITFKLDAYHVEYALKIAPGQEVALTLAYSVTWPQSSYVDENQL